MVGVNLGIFVAIEALETLIADLEPAASGPTTAEKQSSVELLSEKKKTDGSQSPQPCAPGKQEPPNLPSTRLPILRIHNGSRLISMFSI